MVSSQFEAILKQFESFFNCELKSDANNSCLVQFENSISIQLELYRGENLLIGCRLGELPLGRERIPVLQAALKSNELTLPSTGIIGLSPRSNQLIMFMIIEPTKFTISEIPPLLAPYIEKAKEWSEALKTGQAPIVASPQAAGRSSGMFGL